MIIDKIFLELLHFDEKLALIRLRFFSNSYVGRKFDLKKVTMIRTLSDEEICFKFLAKTSRSFALVIQILPDKLRLVVCVYYLILRVLDTIEDDMEYKNLEKKVIMLKNFHKLIDDTKFSVKGFGTKENDIFVAEHFPYVLRVFNSLKAPYKKIIKTTCKEMGNGMAEFVANKIIKIDDINMYNRYTKFVAGILGNGLSKCFVTSDYEEKSLIKKTEISSNSMGLFLQKTNIIKDYLDDINEGRTWWPEEIWSKHATKLDYFKHNPNDIKSTNCLNEMIRDALKLVPDVVSYLKLLKNEKVFAFCAIPQIMAIRNLTLMYNNNMVFKGNVKASKGFTAKVVLDVKKFADFRKILIKDLLNIIPKLKVSVKKSSSEKNKIEKLVNELTEIVSKEMKSMPQGELRNFFNFEFGIISAIEIAIIFVFFSYWTYLKV